ncbi:zf-C2HC5 domain-containing protein [Favolaschia claudopus]|uniref:Zf-C2HC5 domain-containing protein n=1 Tax=Favolaschia claudopus TaxID=2862362 RepID=A0AAW0EE74_9AGAR
MYHTAWTKKGSSSLPSDRIRPNPPPPSTPSKNNKGKGKTAASEPAKSKAVRRLESLKAGVAGNLQKDPKGGCFCQAREHHLSTYTQLCRTCGLILCEINLPQYSCPHCSASLLTATQKDALIARLDAQIAETLTKEALMRERAEEEARLAVGAFPTLGNTVTSGAAPSAPVPQTRMVMSLNSKTKKVTVSSFTKASPSPSRPASRAESVEDEPVRVPPPPPTVPFSAAAKFDSSRPWMDLSGGGAVYIPPPNLDADDDTRGISQRRRNRGKKKNTEGGAQAGVAGSSSQTTST